jgi:hypothetical protein
MTFFPIVERELRMRARQWPTYWGRVIVGAVGTLLCAQMLGAGSLFGSPAQAGRYAFQGLVVISFMICSLGCLATSDSISWERREKTLGLLFLTRVRGVDILLGKFASGSLFMLCALVAFLPMLMLPVLAGGVSGHEAFRVGLVLINTMLLSLVAGLLASARQVHWFKSARAALGIVVSLLLLPLLGQIMFYPTPAVGLLSPLYGVTFAGEAGAAFWISLGLVQLSVWVLFVRAYRELHASLESDLVGKRGGRKERRISRARRTYPARRALTRVAVQPLRWLLYRQRGTRALVWLGAIISILLYGQQMLVPVFGRFTVARWSVTWPVAFVGTVISGVLFAWAASRFFFEARRSGELELLVTTPVGAKTIVWEQWLFLRHLLHWPLVVMLLPILPQFFNPFAGNPSLGLYGNLAAWLPLHFIGVGLASGTVVLSLVAFCWTGMWYGLQARTQGIAVLQTVARVKALPFLFGCGWLVFTQVFIGSFRNPTMVTFLWFSLLPKIGTIVFYGWLIRQMRRRLLGEIRNAEALPFGWSAKLSAKPRSLREALRWVRHWTPS